jgi:multisubunit Na+/H+ antiporter MnhE subunit
MMFVVTVIAALTAVFCLTLASFAWQDMLTGVVLASGLVAMFGRFLFPRTLPSAEYVIHIVTYSPVFLWMLLVDIVKGTWLVASIVVGIRPLTHPGIVKIPLGNHSPAGVGIVGLLVTISPGSFMVDIDWDERVMLVHYMDASNPAQLRADVEKYYRLWEYGMHLPEPDEIVSKITELP